MAPVILTSNLGPEFARESDVTLDFTGDVGSFEQSETDGATTPLQFIAAVRMAWTFRVDPQAEMEHLTLPLPRSQRLVAGASGRDPAGSGKRRSFFPLTTL
jgi:hypothetical protein